jgi:hypothetical protein
MILRPQRNFTIVRQIANHTDTATYYVRAVIRDSYTDVILDTLDLDDKGGQRFTKNWVIAPDPSGLGRDISIVTSVYTDSGYTTKSENYGDEENSHLIEDKEIGRGGGSGVDSRTVRRIIQEELDKRTPEPVEPTEVEEKEPEEPARWDEILRAVDSVKAELKKELKPEKPEKVEFKPLFDALESLRNDIKEKEVTEPTDLTPILEKLGEKEESDEITRSELVSLLSEMANMLSKRLPQQIEQILTGTTFKIAETTAKMEVPKETKEQPVPFDLSKLSL